MARFRTVGHEFLSYPVTFGPAFVRSHLCLGVFGTEFRLLVWREPLMVGFSSRRQRLLSSGAYRCTQRQIVVWSAGRPRSITNSSTSRYDSEYRKYHPSAGFVAQPWILQNSQINGPMLGIGPFTTTSIGKDGYGVTSSLAFEGA